MSRIKESLKIKERFIAVIRTYPIAILAFIYCLMVLIPTYIGTYVPNIAGYIHMNQTQYSEAVAWYGVFTTVWNLLAMWIGGKFKARHLILASMVIQIIITVWYGSLVLQPFVNNPYDNNFGRLQKIQLIIILFFYAVAINGLIWAPMWRIVKNFDTANLHGKEKERKVGKNNGIAGTFQGIAGLIIAVIGTVLLWLTQEDMLPDVWIGNQKVSLAFIMLISIVLTLTILATLLVYFLLKKLDDDEPKKICGFKEMKAIASNWKLWILGFAIAGIFILELELGAQINYLKNIFLISTGFVAVAGIIRTYVLRFLLVGYVGKKADKAHSYLFLILLGIFVGIALTITAILLPGFDNEKTIDNLPYTQKLVLQTIAVLNFFVLGGLTWALVTIRWSSIGTELGITNENYASAISFLSTVGFSPALYFKFIKSYIEDNHKMEVLLANGNKILGADKYGEQLILTVCACVAFSGFLAALILYIKLYRKSDKFAFIGLQNFAKCFWKKLSWKKCSQEKA